MAQGGASSCDSVTKPTKARKDKTNLWEVTQEGHVISSPPSTPDTGVYSVQTDYCCQGVPFEIQSNNVIFQIPFHIQMPAVSAAIVIFARNPLTPSIGAPGLETLADHSCKLFGSGKHIISSVLPGKMCAYVPVSYTHLTLPTKRIV